MVNKRLTINYSNKCQIPMQAFGPHKPNTFIIFYYIGALYEVLQ